MSLDGTRLLGVVATQDRGYDVVMIGDDGDGTIFTDFLRADWDEIMPTVSPDGGMVAYVSNESGVAEVYLRSFPSGEDLALVSDGGGTEPVWAPDGSAIYYREGSRVMRVSISPEEVSVVDTPQEVINGAWSQADASLFPRTNWDVHPDEGSFLFVSTPGAGGQLTGAPVMPVRFVHNWFEELRQRMGAQ